MVKVLGKINHRKIGVSILIKKIGGGRKSDIARSL
jgi:hypothetical protein